MSGLGIAMRACSTFHTDTACPPYKIKRVHDILCRNSQAVHDIFFYFAFVPNWPANTVYIVFISPFNIGPRGNVKTR